MLYVNIRREKTSQIKYAFSLYYAFQPSYKLTHTLSNITKRD